VGNINQSLGAIDIVRRRRRIARGPPDERKIHKKRSSQAMDSTSFIQIHISTSENFTSRRATHHTQYSFTRSIPRLEYHLLTVLSATGDDNTSSRRVHWRDRLLSAVFRTIVVLDCWFMHATTTSRRFPRPNQSQTVQCTRSSSIDKEKIVD
jgi:hypothetical protein